MLSRSTPQSRRGWWDRADRPVGTDSAGPFRFRGSHRRCCDTARMVNRLADAMSPYLLQHADNPVDWWPWSPEAFEEARRRNVPVLLSVGYAACHWCHVMAHESFEDDGTAAYLNEHFVPVKVDREERPDIDAVYMEAVQAATGQGGWPMTVFLDAEAKPFYFGTYFPPEPRHGMPSFRQVLEGVTGAWTDRRGEVDEVAAKVVEDLAGRSLTHAAAGPPGADDLARALLALTREYDAKNAGFGGAPKFPPSMAVEFLLRHHARTGSDGALQMAADTCGAMARGGMYDQLGGGFARYSVDREWRVPHFEKMLYDNALLCRVYAHLWRATGSDLARRVALETADFIATELRTPEGGFASALDADSADADGRHVEGAYYVWTPAQLREALGEQDGERAAQLYGVTEEGTFEEGASVLQLPGDDVPAELRERLLAARSLRPGRAGTTRSSRRGTAWPSRPSPRPVPTSTAPTWSSAPPRQPTCWCGCTWTTAPGSPVRPGTAAPAPTPVSWRTTPMSPRGSSRSPGSPGKASGWSSRGSCSISYSTSSPVRTARSTTPRTTPSR